LTGFDIWVGGYTPPMGTAEGISLLRYPADGTRPSVLGTTPTSSPSFLAVGGGAGNGGVLYATDEALAATADTGAVTSRTTGRVEAFRMAPGSMLEPLGGQPTSGGFPCHVSVTADGLYVSNYLDGSIDVYPLLPGGAIGELRQTLVSTGSGPNPAQDGPHAHSTLVRHSGSRASTVLSADLGADRVHVHPVVDGSLVRASSVVLPPGTGPRDLLALGDRVILLGELQGTIFALDGGGGDDSDGDDSGTGPWRIAAAGALAADWVDGDHAAALAVDGAGRFLYTGLRGSNRVAVIRVSDLSPVATVPCGGDWPRHLCVIPGGVSAGGASADLLLVANQLSSTVAAFRLDAVTGIPHPLGSPVDVASPTFLLPVL
jgi:6-phosphogluconolactonase (cycloisomerase 2 family)